MITKFKLYEANGESGIELINDPGYSNVIIISKTELNELIKYFHLWSTDEGISFRYSDEDEEEISKWIKNYRSPESKAGRKFGI